MRTGSLRTFLHYLRILNFNKMSDNAKAIIEKGFEDLKGEVKKELELQNNRIKEGLTPELEKLEAKAVELFEKSASKEDLDAIKTQMQKMKDQGASNPGAMTLKAQIEKNLKESENYKSWSANPKEKGFQLDLNTKTVGTMTFSNNTTGDIVDNVYGQPVQVVRRRNRLRSLLQQYSISGDKYIFPKQSAGEGSAGTTSEGSSKNQTDKDFTTEEAPVRKITNYMRVSEEMISDLPWLVSILSNQGLNDLLDVEDAQILSGDGNAPNLTGLTVQTDYLSAGDIPLAFVQEDDPQKYDAIIAAVVALANLDYTADIVALHPTDYWELLIQKGSDGQYVNQIVFEDGLPRLAGLTLYPSTAITSGSFLVMDQMQAAGWAQREGITTRFYDQDQDNAIKNLVTIVMEERAALPIFHGDAIFWDSFANVITRITT